MILLVLALVLFLVATIGLAAGKAFWAACVAAGLALVTLAELWPHLALH
jgi:uncharacterized transporter YbjL